MKKNQDHNIHKEEFQLERLAFFSDAVFAIAITLLVIEIKVPELDHAKGVSDLLLANEVAHIIPKFIGVIISFFVIGLYWLSHHRLFGYINRYNTVILWPNLFFLMTIILMPFSTAFLSEYYSPDLKLPIALYTINIIFTGIMSYRLWSIVTSAKYAISTITGNKVVRNYNLTRALAIPLTFLLVLLLSFISGWIPFVVLPFMPLISFIIKKYYKKKYPELIQSHLN